ncbi:hypothetical protein [Cellulomonas sp. SLBN-39]|uniref:hypothetical protein n=1 Tax=Cellulomonas sp. SLBN-39 TaxID=2768446 RepID=UPI00114F3211|nr:hypothetical protein [Cellulomonas sp. SLBN-39]TQL04210.1 hypothetical protein FBY24_3323 [Cellulomonas sp. SLBN-39]
MGRSKSSTWIGGAVVVALLVVTAAWFLLIGPVLTAAAQTREQAEGVRATNDVMRDRIAVLSAQFEEIETYRSELQELRVSVPATADVADYLRDVQRAAEARGLTVTSVVPGTPEEFLPYAAQAAQAAAAAAAAEAATEEGSTDAAAPADVAPAAVDTGVPAGMVDVPVQLTVVGPYAQVVAFIDTLQHGTDRLLLVTSFTGTGQDDAEASGGKPATSVGDLEATISGYLYVLPEDGAATPTDEEAEEPALPGAVDGKNPIVPVG